jgi:ubiquitin-protein ligase
MQAACPCEDIMKHWSPQYGAAKLLDELHTMLSRPDVDAPMCAEGDRYRRGQYRFRPREYTYEQMARQCTWKYAM